MVLVEFAAIPPSAVIFADVFGKFQKTTFDTGETKIYPVFVLEAAPFALVAFKVASYNPAVLY